MEEICILSIRREGLVRKQEIECRDGRRGEDWVGREESLRLSGELFFTLSI